MKIIAGLSRPHSWKPLAEAIMWWEDTKASHFYLRVELAPRVSVVYHAIGSGTEFWGFDGFLKVNMPVYEKEFDLSSDTFHKILGLMVSRLKTKYPKLHLVGLFYKRLVQYLFKKIVKNPFRDARSGAVCVEAGCLILGEAELMKFAEDPEDMGIFEILCALRYADGKELVNAC